MLVSQEKVASGEGGEEGGQWRGEGKGLRRRGEKRGGGRKGKEGNGGRVIGEGTREKKKQGSGKGKLNFSFHCMVECKSLRHAPAVNEV